MPSHFTLPRSPSTAAGGLALLRRGDSRRMCRPTGRATPSITPGTQTAVTAFWKFPTRCITLATKTSSITTTCLGVESGTCNPNPNPNPNCQWSQDPQISEVPDLKSLTLTLLLTLFLTLTQLGQDHSATRSAQRASWGGSSTIGVSIDRFRCF